MKKELSIIIPIYNIDKYLEKCLSSLLPQVDNRMQVILVDDGSIDNSEKICQKYVNLNKNFIYVKQINRGLSAARNTGIEYIEGVYCFFLDGDDYINNETLNYILYKIKEKDLIIFNFSKVDEKGKLLLSTNYKREVYNIKSEKERFQFISKKYLSCKYEFAVWNKIYVSKIIINNDIKFHQNAEIFAEDICFNLEYLSLCSNIEICDKNLYFYVQRPTSIMGTICDTQIDRIAILANRINDWYSSNQYFVNYKYGITLALISHQFWLFGSDNAWNKLKKSTYFNFIIENITKFSQVGGSINKNYSGYMKISTFLTLHLFLAWKTGNNFKFVVCYKSINYIYISKKKYQFWEKKWKKLKIK